MRVPQAESASLVHMCCVEKVAPNDALDVQAPPIRARIRGGRRAEQGKAKGREPKGKAKEAGGWFSAQDAMEQSAC
jgi:hypothetical protein